MSERSQVEAILECSAHVGHTEVEPLLLAESVGVRSKGEGVLPRRETLGCEEASALEGRVEEKESSSSSPLSHEWLSLLEVVSERGKSRGEILTWSADLEKEKEVLSHLKRVFGEEGMVDKLLEGRRKRGGRRAKERRRTEVEENRVASRVEDGVSLDESDPTLGALGVEKVFVKTRLKVRRSCELS